MNPQFRIALTLLAGISVLAGYAMARVIHGEGTWILGILFGLDCAMTLGALWWSLTQRNILYRLAALCFTAHLAAEVVLFVPHAVELARIVGIVGTGLATTIAGFGSAFDTFKVTSASDTRTENSER